MTSEKDRFILYLQKGKNKQKIISTNSYMEACDYAERLKPEEIVKCCIVDTKKAEVIGTM